MGEVLEAFVKLMDGDEDMLSLDKILTKEEKAEWEILVKIFRDIQVNSIVDDVKKVNKFYNLERWQELSVLALVKMMELMIKDVQASPAMQKLQDSLTTLDKVNPPETDFGNGGMFG
tara:strand:- start:384 stop:734 length:351 start_codon:yes stop_codon:yes gene_type:complete